MENSLIKILTEGGLAGIAIVALWCLHRVITNHMAHNTKALNGLENAIIKLTVMINKKIK